MTYYIGRIWDEEVADILKNELEFSIDEDGADRSLNEGIPGITGSLSFKYLIDCEKNVVILLLGSSNKGHAGEIFGYGVTSMEGEKPYRYYGNLPFWRHRIKLSKLVLVDKPMYLANYSIPPEKGPWQRRFSVTRSYDNQIERIISDIDKQSNKSEVNAMDRTYYHRMIETGIHQMIFYGPPGTSKTFDARSLARHIANDDARVSTVQFHPSYSYEDFVRGIRVKTRDNQTVYETRNGSITRVALQAYKEWCAKNHPHPTDNAFRGCKKWVMVIDEINRAHLAAVLGELIFALEYRPRNATDIVNCTIKIPYEIGENGRFTQNGSDEIIIPPNLFIIGTMNTADRSIGHLDYAVRRRFLFEPKLPDVEKIALPLAKTLFQEMQVFFSTNLAHGFHMDDLMPGHTYFGAADKSVLAAKVAYQLFPLLREYVKDGVLALRSEEDVPLWGASPFGANVDFDAVSEHIKNR